jgi:hypothetical protein
MRFNPVARLDPGQVQDLRHNPGFYYWLMQNRMLSPFAQMTVKPFDRDPGLAHAPVMGNAQAAALFQQMFGGR